MCKTLIVLILLFDGTLIQKKHALHKSMTVEECSQIGAQYREKFATYNDADNIWVMNDKSGSWQGFICK